MIDAAEDEVAPAVAKVKVEPRIDEAGAAEGDAELASLAPGASALKYHLSNGLGRESPQPLDLALDNGSAEMAAPNHGAAPEEK
jgi:hypothetical protein